MSTDPSAFRVLVVMEASTNLASVSPALFARMVFESTAAPMVAAPAPMALPRADEKTSEAAAFVALILR